MEVDANFMVTVSPEVIVLIIPKGPYVRMAKDEVGYRDGGLIMPERVMVIARVV